MATPLSPGHPPTPGRLRSSPARVAAAAPTTLPERREGAHVVEISGRCDDGFGAVKDAFAENFEREGDVGATVAVALHGELVVDLWGGHQDEAGAVPGQGGTVIKRVSPTKTVKGVSAPRFPPRRPPAGAAPGGG